MGVSSTLRALAVEPNGKIVTVGYAGGVDAVVTRFNADGTRDRGFGTVTLVGGSSPIETARAVVTQPDGKIVVVGGVTDPMGANDVGVWRLRPSGTPDPSFGGGDGFVEFGDPGSDEIPFAVTLDGQGRIVTAGVGQGLGADVLVLRLTASGLPDPTFNGGQTAFDVPHFGTDVGVAVAVQQDDKVLVGANYAGTSGYAVLRITPGDAAAGAGLDPGFGNVGIAHMDGAVPANVTTDVEVTRDGHILFIDRVPSTTTPGAEDSTVVRLTSGGAVDDTFGSATGARIVSPGRNVTGSALALLPDGNIAVVGNVTTSSFAAELHADGRPVTAMGPGRVKTLRSGEDLAAVAALPDGRIVAGGDILGGQNVLYRLKGDLRPPSCGGKRATIVGTKAPDTLVGTRHADVIAGLGGDDTITGLGKGDILCGGPGNDHLSGGLGGDHLYGGHGRDTLRGGPGRDTLVQ